MEDIGDSVTAKRVKTKYGTFGYLRLWSFNVDDDERFVEAVSAMLRRLPRRGLIVDIRNNPGGYIIACERLLQLFTPNRIRPTKFALRSTPLSAEMAQSDSNQEDLGAWAESLALAQQTGEPYSSHIAISSEDSCNDVGQRYGGPVVLVADANTYSCGDLFAAGFVDNGLGPLVVIGQATGAGGANVWTMDDVISALSQTSRPQPNLPSGASFNLSIRRAVRSGAADGSLIEDMGIAGQPYDMTETDVIENNRDLMDHCASLLISQPTTRFDLSHRRGRLLLETLGIDLVTLHVDGFPARAPVRIRKNGKQSISLRTKPGQIVDAEAYAQAVLRQRRRLFV